MEDNKANAYRAIFDDVLDLYKTDINKVPDLTGAHFMELGCARNDCDYLPNQKYLHFFPDKETALSYAQNLADETEKSVSVVAFHFDEDVLKKFTFTGQYISGLNYMRKLKKKEYIIPLEFFDAKKNMLEAIESVTKKPYDPDGYMGGWFM